MPDDLPALRAGTARAVQSVPEVLGTMRRRRDEGAYIVTGPQERERRALNVSMGVSIAQTYANRRRREEGAFTYYVRDVLGTTIYATVTKEDDGAIVTRPTVAA